jgi:hypothetical protein
MEFSIVLPKGIPFRWTKQQVDEQFKYFGDYYLPGGTLYEHLGFNDRPAITCDEFMRAVIEDFKDAVISGLSCVSQSRVHWALETLERERVRDRILVNRGLAPIDGPRNGLSPCPA